MGMNCSVSAGPAETAAGREGARPGDRSIADAEIAQFARDGGAADRAQRLDEVAIGTLDIRRMGHGEAPLGINRPRRATWRG